MANGRFTLGKQSGGTLGLVFPDGVSDTEMVLPESGNITSVDTANTNVVQNTYSLKIMLMPLRFTFSVANAKMSATALNEMFSILPTVTGQTVTITGNYGASNCNTTIATAKSWTVIK